MEKANKSVFVSSLKEHFLFQVKNNKKVQENFKSDISLKLAQILLHAYVSFAKQKHAIQL